MSSLRFLCHLHERDFDAGFEVDDDTFRRHRLKLVVLGCPWCGGTHRFLLADGRRTAARQPEKPAIDGGQAQAMSGHEGHGRDTCPSGQPRPLN